MNDGARRLLGITTAGVVAFVIALLLPALVAVAGVTTSPSAPRAVAAAPRDGAVKVTWRAPKKTGGAVVKKYRVTRTASGIESASFTVGADRRSFVVPDLTNGTEYAFTVRARNKKGWSKPSAAVTAVPRTVAGAPQGLALEMDHHTAALSWSPPASDGGAAVSGYTVERSVDGGAAWLDAATVTTTDLEVGGLAYGSTYGFRVRALNAAGAGAPSDALEVTPQPPDCPDPLPVPGPYLDLVCDPGEGVVETSCTNPDWRDLNGEIGDGCEATRQMPVFVPGNSQGVDSAEAYADRLTGSFWLSGYPGSREPADWFAGPLMHVPVAPSCGGSPALACPGGQPQDPPAELLLDFTEYGGDLPRSTGTAAGGTPRIDVTLRARVTTIEPIALTANGMDCLMEIDSSAGSSPDWRVDVPVSFVGPLGWEQQPAWGDVSLTQVEDADVTITGGFLCGSVGWGIGFYIGALTDAFSDQFNENTAALCGAQDPYWWQACRPIVEEPPPPPPEPEPVTSCPDAPPPAGPYMTLSCHPQTGSLVVGCHPDWLDANGEVADGCERSVDGVVPLSLNEVSDQAFADRVSGTFYLGGYPGGVGEGPRYFAPNPRLVRPLPCTETVFGCPMLGDQDPLPNFELDFSQHPGDEGPRREAIWNGDDFSSTIALRARVRTSAPVVFEHQGVTCWVSVHSGTGSTGDAMFPFRAAEPGDGSVGVAAYDFATVSDYLRIEDIDIELGPHRWCRYYAQARRGDVRPWVYRSVVEWAAREGDLCGATQPYLWQPCPD